MDAHPSTTAVVVVLRTEDLSSSDFGPTASNVEEMLMAMRHRRDSARVVFSSVHFQCGWCSGCGRVRVHIFVWFGQGKFELVGVVYSIPVEVRVRVGVGVAGTIIVEYCFDDLYHRQLSIVIIVIIIVIIDISIYIMMVLVCRSDNRMIL